MPHVPSVPPAHRFFARIDKFECECPACGTLITTGADQRKDVPIKLQIGSSKRATARKRLKSRNVLGLVWNPYAQRLQCPFCGVAYVAGLLLWPVQPGARRLLHPPPDAKPSPRELLELRRITGGFWAEEAHWDTHHVNLVVPAGCTCPEGSHNPTCAIHHPAPAQQAKVAHAHTSPTAESESTPRVGGEK